MAVKKSRFEQLQVLKKADATEEVSPAQFATLEEANPLESLSSQMRRDLKSALKQASAREHRKQYQLIEEAVIAYLEKKHPSLLE